MSGNCIAAHFHEQCKRKENPRCITDDHATLLPLVFINISCNESALITQMRQLCGYTVHLCALTVLISKHVTRVSSVTQLERRSEAEAEVCSSSRTPGHRASPQPALRSLHALLTPPMEPLTKVTLPFALPVPRRYQPQCSNIPVPMAGAERVT